MQKYLNLLKSTPYHVEIVSLEDNKPLPSADYIYHDKLENIINEILQTDVDSLSISQAYDFLYDIQNKLNMAYKESFGNETKK